MSPPTRRTQPCGGAALAQSAGSTITTSVAPVGLLGRDPVAIAPAAVALRAWYLGAHGEPPSSRPVVAFLLVEETDTAYLGDELTVHRWGAHEAVPAVIVDERVEPVGDLDGYIGIYEADETPTEDAVARAQALDEAIRAARRARWEAAS